MMYRLENVAHGGPQKLEEAGDTLPRSPQREHSLADTLILAQ